MYRGRRNIMRLEEYNAKRAEHIKYKIDATFVAFSELEELISKKQLSFQYFDKSFTMNNYKKWTGAQREKSYRLFCKARDMGLIESPHKCEICGQTKGILMTHNTDYNVTLSYLPKLLDGTANDKEKAQIQEVLIPVCWRCHMILHSHHRNPTAYKNYFHEVKTGKQYPPVYKHDFDILKENGF